MKNLLATLFAALLTSNASAQQITLLVPYNPGGLTDVVARAVQTELTKDGNQVVVANRPGGDGLVALNEMLAQKSNITTLLVAAPGVSLVPSALNPEFNAKFNSLVPVIPIAYNMGMLVASKNSGITNFNQLMFEIKVRNINFGSSSPLVRVIYQSLWPNNQNVNMIPFAGEGPVVTQLLGNHIDVAWLTINGTNLQHVSTGNLIELVSTNKKSTNQSTSIDKLRVTIPTPFIGIFSPAGTSETTRENLNKMLTNVVNKLHMAEFYTNQFLDRPEDLSADNFSKVLSKQLQIYKSILTKN